MNEPIERAQAVTGKVTAGQLLAVVKQGSKSLSLHGEATYNRPSYSDSFTFTLRATRGAYGSRAETQTTIDVPGYVSNGNARERRTTPGDGTFGACMSYCDSYRPVKGFWYLAHNETLRAVLETLPRSAEVAFYVYLDAGTNEYLVRAECDMGSFRESGLHSDHLYLCVRTMRRGKPHEARFMIDASTGAHNTARFGQGG